MNDKAQPLVLGWQVDNKQETAYWSKSKSKGMAGKHDPTDLVTVNSEDLETHIAIVAQSGSGKSYLLGRLVEEILLKTKARCVILDTNGDFRYLDEVAPSDNWLKAGTCAKFFGLPHEAKQKDFELPYSKRPKQFLVGSEPDKNNGRQRLEIRWGQLDPALIFETDEATTRYGLAHCHKFVDAIARILSLQDEGARKEILGKETGLLPLAQTILRECRGATLEMRTAYLRNKMRTDEASKPAHPTPNLNIPRSAGPLGLRRWTGPFTFPTERLRFDICDYRPMLRNIELQAALDALEHITQEAEQLYFSAAHYLASTGLIGIYPYKVEHSAAEKEFRLTVVDIPSIGQPFAKALAVNYVLQAIWDDALVNWHKAMAMDKEKDDRVPTFIVVDEAHNFATIEPSSNSSRVIRDQLRTIAAEGRKYGVFLVLCTQRPDKIDPLVVSECGNRIVMKLGSEEVAKRTKGLLGLDDASEEDVTQFCALQQGVGYLSGKWAAQKPTWFRTAMRRTKEGGRSLPKNWQSPLA